MIHFSGSVIYFKIRFGLENSINISLGLEICVVWNKLLALNAYLLNRATKSEFHLYMNIIKL